MIQIVRKKPIILADGSPGATWVYTDPKIDGLNTIDQVFSMHAEILATLPEDQRDNLYFTVAHHVGAKDANYPQRTKATFEYQTVLAFDIDADESGPVDTSKPFEYGQCISTVLATPLATIRLVVSGNGIHGYAGLKDPIKSPDFFDDFRIDYREVCRLITAEIRKKGLFGAAKAADCFDAGRIMRLPGSQNVKPGKEPKACVLIQNTKAVLNIDLHALSGMKAMERENVSPHDIRRIYPTPDFQEIIKECGFVNWCIHKPQEVHEPQVFDLISLVATWPENAVVDTPWGEATPKQLVGFVIDNAKNSESLKHTSLDEKWDHAKKYGARKCSTIHGHWIGGCEKCPHFGKIASPLALKSQDHIGSEQTGYWVYSKKGTPLHPHYEDLSRVYRHEQHYVVGSGERIFTFRKSHYTETSELEIKSWLERKVTPSEPLREAHRNEFLHKVKALGGISQEIENALFYDTVYGKMNCGNGILDIISGEMTAHRSAVGFRYLLPYEYHPGGTSERFLDWLSLVTENRTELMDSILDLMAYMIWPSYDDHLFAFFVGEGKNGKSTLMHLMQAIVGRDNYVALSIQQLGGNKFAPSMLDGKLVNLAEEASGGEMSLEAMNQIKTLSSGGTTQGERKGQDLFTFMNRAKLYFSANQTPKFQEHGLALTRRMIVIPFDYKIEVPDSRVESALLSDIPKIVSMLVRRIQENVARNGGRFVVNRGGEVAKVAQVKVITSGNTVVEWANECLESSAEISSETYIASSHAYDLYRQWCAEAGYRNVKNKINFGKDMCDFVITPACRERNPVATVNGRSCRVYRRTKLKDLSE